MTAAEVKGPIAAVLRAVRLVVISIGCRMRQMAGSGEVKGALHDLGRTWHYRQSQDESTESAAPGIHEGQSIRYGARLGEKR